MTRKSQRLNQKTAQTNKSYDQKNCKGSNRRLCPNQQMTRKRRGTGPRCPVPKFLAVCTLLYRPVPSAAVPCCVLPCAQCPVSQFLAVYYLVPSVAVPCCVLPCAQCPVSQFLSVYTLLYRPVPSAQCRSSLRCPPSIPSAEVPCCVHPIVLPSAAVPCCVHPTCPVPQFLAVSTLHAQCRSSLLCPPYMPSAAVPCCVHAACPVPQSLAVSTQHAQCCRPLLCPRSMPSAAVPCCVHAACPVSKSLAVSTTHAHAVPQLLALSTLHAPPRAPATAGRQRSNRPFINTVTAGDEWGVRAGALSGEFRRSVSRPVPEPRSLAGPVPGKGRKWMSGPVSVLMK